VHKRKIQKFKASEFKTGGLLKGRQLFSSFRIDGWDFPAIFAGI
jgi:hypothetical protein